MSGREWTDGEIDMITDEAREMVEARIPARLDPVTRLTIELLLVGLADALDHVRRRCGSGVIDAIVGSAKGGDDS